MGARPWSFLSYGGGLPDRSDALGTPLMCIRRQLSSSSWMDVGNGLLDPQEWFAYSNMATFPHIVFFDSIPDFLTSLNDLDAVEVSTVMHSFSDRLLVLAKARYSEAISQIILE